MGSWGVVLLGGYTHSWVLCLCMCNMQPLWGPSHVDGLRAGAGGCVGGGARAFLREGGGRWAAPPRSSVSQFQMVCGYPG